MGKFKVGDKVIGNKKASVIYGITVEGWKGTVTAVNSYQIRVYGPGSINKEGVWVNPDCFDLVLPAPNNHLDELISIFTRKNRVVATITKGEQKFTQSISLHKANGDFKAAVKMVMEKLLDRFEAGEQAPLTATSIDWESFKSGKFAVHCDTEEKAEAFLKECDEQGIKWRSGYKTSSFTNWKDYRENTYYRFIDGTVDNGICYGNLSRVHSLKIIDYTPSKPAVKEVKRPAKVGEWIKVVDGSGHDNGTGIFKVTSLNWNNDLPDWVYVNDESSGIIRGDQYVVLENYQPEQSSLESKANYTTEIQIGDTVKVVNNGRCYTRYEEWFVKNAPQYLGKFAYGGMPKNGGSYKVLMKNDKDGFKYVIQEIDWPNDAVYLIDEKGIEKVK